MRSATTKTVLRSLLLPGLATLLLALVPACKGDQGLAGRDGAGQDGPAGPAGPAGSDGQDGQPGVDGESFVIDQSLSPIDKAFVGIGGQDAILGLTSVILQSTGGRWAGGEFFRPEDPVQKASFFDLTISADLAAGMRLDYQRDIQFIGFDVQTSFSEIIAGNVGVVDGIESIFGFPTGDMVSARWASTIKQQRILNPHLILRDIAMDPTLVLDDTGVALLDGSVHHLVVVYNDVSPITLWVNRTTGWINKLTFMENEPLHRDIDVEVLYYGWAPTSGGGLLFPSDVYIALDGTIVHEETRSSIQVNPGVPSSAFEFPMGSAPTFDATDAHRGEANHQFHQSFASIGIPLDAQQTFVNPIQLSPGVYYLTGGSHHSLLVEQANGLVLVEAPLDEWRSEAILGWTQATFPNKSITHVITTHHHSDHAGGIRTIVAEGAVSVISESSTDFFKDIFSAPSTILPDALALNPVAVQIEPVAENGTFSINDATNTVTAYHLPNPHAVDMLIVHVPSANVVFQSDLLNTGVPVTIYPPFQTAGVALFEGIAALGFASPTLVMAGGHGSGTNTYQQFQTALGL